MDWRRILSEHRPLLSIRLSISPVGPLLLLLLFGANFIRRDVSHGPLVIVVVVV